MNSSAPSDPELLAAWLHHRREPAFRELVNRYAGLVQMTARRTCGDASLATEAAQLTFITLARKAESLLSCASLGGWLHRTAMLQAKNLLRKSQSESRKRQALESAMETRNLTRDGTWQDLQPLLDDALAALSDRDREALLLRFYRALSVKEVAATLGIATDAAQKRVDRATQRLHGHFARRGLTTGTTLSGTMLAGFAADAQAAAPAVSLLASKAIAASTTATTATSTFLTAAAMKTTSAVVPLVVLLAAGGWLAGQLRSIAELKNQNAQLQATLTEAEHSAPPPRVPVATKTPLDRKPVDWVEVARQLKLAQSESGAPLKSTARLEAQLSAMSKDELLAALDEIEATTLPKDDRELLEERLCHEVVKLKGGPELVLDRFASRIGEGSWAWTLAAYFGNWIDSEPDPAIAWLHQHAAELSKPEHLVSQAFFPRLTSDPATASRLLTALPESKRLDSLRTLEPRCLSDPKMQAAWANTFRTDLPEKDRLKAVLWPTCNWSDGDGSRMSMTEVGAYMDRIDATPAEREACIMGVAEELAEVGTFDDRFDNRNSAQKIEALRTWVAAQAPQLLDRATGIGLGGLAEHGTTYAEAAEIALSYYESNPNDELLTPLLERDTGDESRPSARVLAARLSDESLRRKFLKKHK